MKITVKWTNRNEVADGHRIYKSETPIDPLSLPEIEATLAGDVAEWVDEDVVRGTRYYYRVATFKGEDVAISTEIEAEAIPYNGPGPEKLLFGDYEAGIFGVLESFDFISGPELKELTGHKLNAGEFGQRWVKVAHKGKILYVAVGSGFGRHTYLDLYKAGMVFGVDGNGDAAAVTANGEEGVNQLVTFSKFGSTFKVRCLKGLPEGYDGPFNAVASEMAPTGLEESEFNQVFTRIAYGAYGKGAGVVVSDITPNVLGDATYSAAGNICQELVEGKAIHRSLRWGAESVTGAIGFMPPNAASSTTGFPSTIYSTWRPVVELIEN